MAYRFKFNKIGCLSLSKACIILGLLDLVINSYIIAVMLMLLRTTDSFGGKFLLALASIGIFTCLFMMAGSRLEIHQSMLPHIAWELFLVITYAVIGVILLGNYSHGDRSINIAMIIVILGCAPILSFLYWSIIYSRYLDIKEKQCATSEQIEVE